MKLSRFVKHRLSHRRFTGFPLTILAGVALTFSYLLIELAEEVLNSESVIVLDKFVVDAMYLIRFPFLTDIFAVITTLGVTEFVVAAVAGVSLILLLRKDYNSTIALLITVGGTAGITYYAKLFFKRPRPELALYAEKLYSFPSGHASISVALYGFIAYLLWRQNESKERQMWVIIIATLFILLIGISRLYFGVHYLSDVIEGYLLGGIFLIVGIIFSEIYHPSSLRSRQ